jgi:hypothetical protein
MDSTNDVPHNPSGIAGAPLQPVIKSDKRTFEAYEASNAIPESKPKADINESIDALHNTGPLETLRTYESDIARAVKHKNTSVVKIAVAEQKRAVERHEFKPASSDPKIKAYSLSLSLILILGGVIALGGIYFFVIQNKPTPVVPGKIEEGKIFSTESEKQIVLTENQNPQDVLKTILENPASKDEALTRLIFTENVIENNVSIKKPLDSQSFITRLQTHMDSGLARSLGPDYVVGYQFHNSEIYPFFIFKVSSFENAYAGMLTWEENMTTDLASILPRLQSPIIVQATTTASSTKNKIPKTKTASSTTSTVVPHFIDQVINNKDTRMYKNSNGVPLLYYSFPTKDTLIITTSDATLKEIFARLVTSQFVK